MLFNMLSKGYISEYKVDGFKVVEKRVKRTKGEIDNYYFEIFNDDLSFNIQTFKNLSKQENVIKEIKYFEDNNYKCILPITKQDIVFSDIVCKGNDGYYNYNTIEGKDSELDEFANSLSNYRTTFISSDKKAKSDSYITVYENLEDDFNLGLENYKGIYLVNKKYGFINNELFTKDIYTKDIKELNYGYRTSYFKDNPQYIILEITLNLKDYNSGSMDIIKDRLERRKNSQPLNYPSCGSVFRNSTLPAGKLIEDAGLKGVSIGGASVSQKHANFIINNGNASSEDIKKLISLVHDKVLDMYNIDLIREVEYKEW